MRESERGRFLKSSEPEVAHQLNDAADRVPSRIPDPLRVEPIYGQS